MPADTGPCRTASPHTSARRWPRRPTRKRSGRSAAGSGRPKLVPVVRPELGEVLTGLIGTLIRHGLAEQTDKTREAMEQLGKEFQDQINRQTAAASRGQRPGPIGQRPPTVRRIERSWSPTELGEQVLDFYIDAGAEADITDR